MLRLLAGAVGEPDDCEAGYPGLQVCLDLDLPWLEPDQGMGNRACKHATTVGAKASRRGDAFAPKVRDWPWVKGERRGRERGAFRDFA
jgi:hypothetical protein